MPTTHGRNLAREIAELRAFPLTDLGGRAMVLISGLSDEEVPTARMLILDAPPFPNSDLLVTNMIERWARMDGPAAFAYASRQTTAFRTMHQSSALKGWAYHDPRAAWNLLMVESNRAADRRYDEEGVLAVAAETNLLLALELFEDLTSVRSCLLCNAMLLTSIALRHDQLPLITDSISRMAPGPTREALRDGYWETVGRYMPEIALAEASQAGNVEDQRAARVHIAKGWAIVDFERAFDHVVKEYDPVTREQALLPVIQMWAVAGTPEEVKSLIRELPADLTERSLLGVVGVLARVDPAAAAEWAVSLQASDVRTACIDRAMWQWARIDSDGAYRFYKAQQDTETAGILLWNFLLSRVGNNTLRLADLDDVSDRFNLDWRVRLLSKISLNLADPSVNRTGSFDLKAYGEWIRDRAEFSDSQREKILQPIRALSSNSNR